jgi:heme A synthase
MGVHRFAVATALATFLLLVAGGLVSTTESGLACPDWPLCEGQFIPRMVDGKQYEHTHRLVASFVATMTFGLCALLFKHRRRDKLLTRLGLFASLAVIAQALLGALTVKLKLPAWVSSTHLAVAMVFFATAVTLAFLTKQRLPSEKPTEPLPQAARLGRVAIVAGLVWYAQIVVGAVMRHVRGGLACGFDFPLCLGQWWPGGHFGVQIHMVHRTLGFIAAATVMGWALCCWRTGRRSLRLLGAALIFGAAAQVGLGIATVMLGRDMWAMTAHSSLGAAMWAALVSSYWMVKPVQPMALERSMSQSPRPTLEPA